MRIIQHVELSGGDLGNPSPTGPFGDKPFNKELFDGPAGKALYRHPNPIYLYKVYLVKVIDAESRHLDCTGRKTGLPGSGFVRSLRLRSELRRHKTPYPGLPGSGFVLRTAPGQAPFKTAQGAGWLARA